MIVFLTSQGLIAHHLPWQVGSKIHQRRRILTQPVGYVGEDVDQAVHRLLIAAKHDVRRAQSGIICLDEFDKLAKTRSMQGTKDVSGEVRLQPGCRSESKEN